MQHTWPGNLQELQNVLEREMILAQTPVLKLTQMSAIQTPHNTHSNAQTLAEVEKIHITQILQHTQWRISGASGAAATLDLPPSTLRSRMKKLKIERPI